MEGGAGRVTPWKYTHHGKLVFMLVRATYVLCEGLLLWPAEGSQNTFSRLGIYLIDVGRDGESFH
jgi:hypothetical protein